MTSNKGFPSTKTALACWIGVVLLVLTFLVYPFLESTFKGSAPLMTALCVTLGNALICGLVSSYISKESSFFFLGLLLGEIGVAIAIVMHVNDKQKSTAGSKISSGHRQSTEDKYATLEHLDSLHKKKIITEKEFQTEKRKILRTDKKNEQ